MKYLPAFVSTCHILPRKPYRYKKCWCASARDFMSPVGCQLLFIRCVASAVERSGCGMFRKQPRNTTVACDALLHVQGRGLSQRCRALTHRPTMPQRSSRLHLRVRCTADPNAAIQPDSSLGSGDGGGGNSGNGSGGGSGGEGDDEEYLNKDQVGH